MSEIFDYSEGLIKIMRNKKKCHEYLLKRDWKQAIEYADKIILAAAEVKLFCEQTNNP
jgi:hypothetical protein